MNENDMDNISGPDDSTTDADHKPDQPPSENHTIDTPADDNKNSTANTVVNPPSEPPKTSGAGEQVDNQAYPTSPDSFSPQNHAKSDKHRHGQRKDDWSHSPYIASHTASEPTPIFAVPQQSAPYVTNQLPPQTPIPNAPTGTPNHGTAQADTARPQQTPNQYTAPPVPYNTPQPYDTMPTAPGTFGDAYQRASRHAMRTAVQPPAAYPHPGNPAGSVHYTTPGSTGYQTAESNAFNAARPAMANYGNPNTPTYGSSYDNTPSGYPNGLPPYSGHGNKERWNVLCIIGFILAFFFPITGLVLSIVALVQMKRTHERSKGMSIAGIIISALRLLLNIVIIVILLSSVGVFGNQHSYGYTYSNDDCDTYGDCREDSRPDFNDRDDEDNEKNQDDDNQHNEDNDQRDDNSDDYNGEDEEDISHEASSSTRVNDTDTGRTVFHQVRPNAVH